ncbi:uncharacterized protein LOC112494064 [Cephus cinctus]|uniref:Uncharacterized protein LOC112494064 n=1 Tax=Cephus cinctus TaxID=211228 RepID=A0AAJ7RD98_CEPCN|nr:uncharacterized protein LOC112494064 [Cephus cinctus]
MRESSTCCRRVFPVAKIPEELHWHEIPHAPPSRTTIKPPHARRASILEDLSQRWERISRVRTNFSSLRIEEFGNPRSHQGMKVGRYPMQERLCRRKVGTRRRKRQLFFYYLLYPIS